MKAIVISYSDPAMDELNHWHPLCVIVNDDEDAARGRVADLRESSFKERGPNYIAYSYAVVDVVDPGEACPGDQLIVVNLPKDRGKI